MIKLKSPEEIKILREGGRRLASVLQEVSRHIKPGVKTIELDHLAQDLIKKLGDTPAFLGYKPKGAPRPYPAALCVSVNDQVVHGIPGQEILEEGDLVSIDLGLTHNGLITDSAVTVGVGNLKKEDSVLLDVTKEALKKAIEVVKPGGRVGDIGFAVETYVKDFGFGIVRDLAGHGVGYSVHEEPSILNYGKAGTGAILKEGLVIAIEPMLAAGSHQVSFLDDGFTFVTTDGSMSAHFEHTVAVTKDGVEILTIN